MRIPKKIYLPWKWEVTVKQLGDKAIDDMATDVNGLWDVDDRTIYLRRSLPIAEKVNILTHEVLHMFTDWQLEVTQKAGFYQQSQKSRKRLAKRASRRCK